MEKVFIVEETGEKIVGTIEGIYKVPEGRIEESLKEFLKKRKQKLFSNKEKKKYLIKRKSGK